MRFGQKIYWCKKLKSPTGMQRYESPVEITLVPGRFSIGPANGYSALVQFGDKISQYQQIICQPYDMWFKKFSIGDKFYADGLKPCKEENSYGEMANYVVDAVYNQNEVIRIILKGI